MKTGRSFAFDDDSPDDSSEQSAENFARLSRLNAALKRQEHRYLALFACLTVACIVLAGLNVVLALRLSPSRTVVAGAPSASPGLRENGAHQAARTSGEKAPAAVPDTRESADAGRGHDTGSIAPSGRVRPESDRAQGALGQVPTTGSGRPREDPSAAAKAREAATPDETSARDAAEERAGAPADSGLALPERSSRTARRAPSRVASRVPGVVPAEPDVDPARRTAAWMVREYGRPAAEERARDAVPFYRQDRVTADFWSQVLAYIRQSGAP
jgi:hypothetical protein